jgi:MFS family permease
LEAINKEKLKKAVRKNMILLLLGQSVSLFGTSIYTFAISLYILSITGSGLSFSLSLALGALPGVLFSPISGVVADRFDRKKMVVVMDIVSGLVVIGLLVLSVFAELKLIYIYVTTFLLATCSIFFNTSLFSA